VSFRGAHSANDGAQLRTIVRDFVAPRNDGGGDDRAPPLVNRTPTPFATAAWRIYGSFTLWCLSLCSEAFS